MHRAISINWWRRDEDFVGELSRIRRTSGESSHGLWWVVGMFNHGRMNRRLLSISFICSLIFLVVALPERNVATDATHPGVYYGIDRAVARLGLSFGEPGRRWLFPIAKASPLVMLLGVLSCALVAARRKRIDLLLLSTLSFLLTIPLVETGLKNWVNRTSYGHTMYPSGHTTLATATSMIVGLTIWQLKGARATRRIAPLSVLYVFAEIALLLRVRAHWFTDTVGGVCVGVGWICFCFALLHPIQQKVSARRIARGRRGKHSWRGPESIPYRKRSHPKRRDLEVSDLEVSGRSFLVDGDRHCDILRGNGVPNVVGGERDMHTVVGIGPRWMVVQSLCDQSDFTHEDPRVVEVTEDKRAM
jgi:membrane-associated phospholipid phosphatase